MLRGRHAAQIAGSAVLAFLMLPILAVVPASFNHATYLRLPPENYSLRWYRAFFADPEWLAALGTSIQIAIVVTVISVVIGALAAMGLERLRPAAQKAVIGLVLSPLIVPVIMTSVALYYVARPLGLHGTVLGLALGHTLLCLPFVVINVGIALRGIDPNCLRAADGLGASAWYRFRTVTLPLIRPGLAGGVAFSFVTSFDEVVISIFLAGAHVKTLPVKMWETIRVEFTPVTAVASTLLLALTLVMFAAAQIVHRRSAGTSGHG